MRARVPRRSDARDGEAPLKTTRPILIRAGLIAEEARIARVPLTIVTAPGGCGKTTLLRRWRDDLRDSGERAGWLALTPLHADAGVFVEDLLGALRDAVPVPAEGEPAFGESLARLIPQAAELTPDRWARRIERELRPLDEPPLLFLDGFERLERTTTGHRIVDALLRFDPPPLRLVIATRGTRPDAATLRIADGGVVELGADDLSLHTDQVEAVLRDSGVEPDPELVAQLLSRTHGWAIAVRLCAHALARGAEDDRRRFVAHIGEQRDLFRYIGSELLGSASPGVVELLETAAVLGHASRAALLAAARVPEGSQRIDEAIDAGLLLSDGRELGLHDLWAEWLRERASQRADRSAWLELQRRVAEVLAAEGQPERALEVLVYALPAPELEEPIVELLMRHGDAWVSQGRQGLPRRALDALPAERRSGEPGLLALDGLLLAGRDPERAITHLKQAAEGYALAGNRRAEFTTLHELVVIAFNENRLDETRAVYRRALKLRRLVTEAPLRGFVVMALAGGAMFMRRYGLALRLLEAAETYEHHPRERAGLAILQATIWSHQGDWQRAEQNIAGTLARPEQREHGTSYHVLHVERAAIRVARRLDTPAERAELEEASEFFADAHHSLNQLRAEYVLGYSHARAAETEEALRCLDRAAALAYRIGLGEAEAAALGGIAQLHRRRGDVQAAREAARTARERLDAQRAWASRWGSMPLWSAGIALACSVSADLGDVEEASEFVETHRRWLQHRELPLCLHAFGVCRARIALRAGDPNRVRAALQSAWAAAEGAGLDHFAFELDEELTTWALREARSLGLSPDYLATTAASLGIDRPRELWIRSFGGLAVERGGRRVAERSWRGTTGRRLLMRLLAAEGTPLQRERIEADLWPDATPAKARNSLRVALSRLRDVLDPRRQRDAASPLVAVEGDRIGLTPEAIEAWDVTRWRACLERARAALESGDEARALEAAREVEELGSEPYLPEGYDDWVVEQRRELSELLIREGRALASRSLESGRHQAAVQLARMVLGAVPEDEPCWELWVRACLARGDRAGARRALDRARDQLRRHLDVEPGPALQELAKRL